MFDEEKYIKRKRNIIRSLPFIPFLLFLILFRKDVGETIGFFLRSLLRYVGFSVELLTPNTPFSLAVVGFNFIFGFLLFFLIWLFLISKQALLPVSSLGETIQTAFQLVFYILKAHGPAVFIQDGKIRADAEELRRNFPGVAVVDSNSALVLEQISWAPRLLATIMDLLLLVINLVLKVIRFHPSPRDPVRVCGPGLIFIKYDERIQGVGDLAQEFGPVTELTGVVDLRRQFKLSRKQGNYGSELVRTSIGAYTRDGIELTTNVWALFSIGLEPDKVPNVIHVVCDGGQSPENLRIVSLTEKDGTIRIEATEDELDPEDRDEIFNYLLSESALSPYAPIAKDSREPVYDVKRVFSAVYGRSRSHADKDEVLPWMKLPVKVAIDYFREILSHYNFDELYQQDDDGKFMINTMRAKLRNRMRNCGLLCYRFVSHQRPGWPLVMDGNSIFHKPDHLLVSPVRALENSKILRDRGIQMIAAGFGNLVPADDVYLQWLSSWRAQWERDTKAARAVAELDAKRIYNHARVRAQQELTLGFQEIFENKRHSKEALALHILQTLETIAADRETQRLLPADTITMLRSIHDWLLPEDLGLGMANHIPPVTFPRQGED